jgi:phosphoribosylamine--glycine ligase
MSVKLLVLCLRLKAIPETSSKDDVISGLDTQMTDAKIFHAGTANNANGDVVTAGGRVLCVTR